MTWRKKFQRVGGTKGVIVPKDWIRSEESTHHRKMKGVYIRLVRVDKNNEKLELTPMWE